MSESARHEMCRALEVVEEEDTLHEALHALKARRYEEAKMLTTELYDMVSRFESRTRPVDEVAVKSKLQRTGGILRGSAAPAKRLDDSFVTTFAAVAAPAPVPPRVDVFLPSEQVPIG